MAVTQWPFVAAVLLLVSHGLQCSPPLPACPVSCFCWQAPLLNCSSSGLSLAPQHIQATVTELDLSHNLLNSVTLRRPHQNLRNVWLGNNSITHLSFCMGRIMGTQYVRSGHPHYWRPWSRQGCVSWAPALQLLSVERNQLLQLPEGLGGSESLRVLQLSYNKISTLRPEDLRHLGQLKELHLQHNLITSLHSQALGDLAQLRVLDLSFNLLTTLHPLTYLSLRNIGAEVRLSGNKWQCDCSMQSLRRWMDYDSNRVQQAWIIVCASPSTLSGSDLLQLEEDDLICFNGENRPGIHQDVTVDRGTEILLPCSTQQDSTWWMPNGQMSVSQSQAGLLISDITERDAGLYVCVSKSHQEIVSVFNLQIRKIEETKRKARSPRSSQPIIPQGIPHRMGQGRKQNTTQSHLALAVCLSVFITFLVAFILGVLARPLIDVLWRRILNKKSSSPTHSVSSAEQRPHDNEAYSSGEESEEIGTPRERRVAFSTGDFRGPSSVPYYDTVASSNQENIYEGAVMECEAAEDNHQSEKDKHMAGDSGSDSNSHQGSPEDNQRGGGDCSGVTDPGPTHNMEFEHIPDPGELEESRSLSSHSYTSLSDKEQKEEQMTQRDPWTPQLVEDPFQQRSKSPSVRPVEVPQISMDGRGEIPGFSSEPFADWSPHIKGENLMELDLSYESGENFEFTDSIHSASERSSILFGSFNNSNQIVFPPSDNWKGSDGSRSSSSSNVSENEPTQYIVNPETEEEEDVEMIQNGQLTRDTKREITNTCLQQDVSFEQQIHGEDPIRPSLQGEGFNQGDYRHDTQRPPMGPEHSDSSHSSDSDEERTQYTVNQETDENEEREGKVSRFEKSVSSMTALERDRAEEVSPMPGADLEPEAKWFGHSLSVPLICKHLDTRAPSLPAACSSSSRSDSEAVMRAHKKVQNKDRMEVGITSHEPETRWPDLDLKSIPQIKRRLDIKAPSPPPDSCFSRERSDETTDHIVKQQQGEVNIEGLPFKESPIVSHEPETRWADLDLGRITCIKRRLDIKAPSPTPDSSSSSSESEDGTTDTTVKLEGDRTDVGITNHEPETKWPNLSLGVPCIKRRLDIKAPSQPDDSRSSCSDTENEMTNFTVKQERDRADVKITSHTPETKLPDLSLAVPHIKRRLDIKAPSPQAGPVLSSVPPGPLPAESNSSSSESENENRDHTAKLERAVVSRAAEKESVRSPTVTLMNISLTPKRTHNIKLEKYAIISDGLEDKTTAENISPAPNVNPELESQWSGLNLGISRFRRRLDITSRKDKDIPPKMPSLPPPESSSSSSESGAESKSGRMRQKREGVGMQGIMKKESVNVSLCSKNADNFNSNNSVEVKERLRKDNNLPTTEGKSDPEAMLARLSVPHIKRYLDINVTEEAPPAPPLPQPPDASSSSDNENKSTDYAGERWQLPDVIDKESPQTPVSLYPTRAVNINFDQSESSFEEAERKAKLDLKSQMSKVEGELESKWPHLSLSNVIHMKRNLDIKAPSSESESSFSSKSEDETIHHTVQLERDSVDIKITSHERETKLPDLSPGVPRIKRYLNIKAPSPQPTDSSCSTSERTNEVIGHTTKQNRDGFDLSGITLKESQITSHKHVDIKVPSNPSDLSPSSSENETTDHTTQGEKKAEKLTTAQEDSPLSVGRIKASLAPRRVINISFDDVVRRRIEQARGTPAVDLPTELRWTAIGHLPDLPTSNPRRYLVAGSQSAQEAPPAVPGSPPPDTSSSSSESGDEMKPAPSRALNIMFDNSSSSTDELVWRDTSEDTRESKGLRGLKGLLSERQKWDTGHEEMERGSSPLWGDQGSSFQAATSFNYHSSEKDIKPLDKLSLPELLLSSTSVDNTRAGGSPHNFPRHRWHVVGGIQPSLEAPPPFPAEPPPEEEEAAGPTQRSPQSSEKQEWQSMGSYQQRERAMEGFGRSSLFSISRGDEEERSTALVGILGATPYHTARRYQSVSTTTTQTVSFDCEESNMTFPSSSV